MVLERLRNMRKVLVVSKRTRLEFASTRFGGVSGNELEDLLEERGFPHKRIVSAHHAHHDSLDQIVRALSRRDVSVNIVRAPALIPTDLDNIDCVMTAGGDGTVLETAARVKSSTIPVVTINTDPNLSHGHLCAFSLKQGVSFENGVLDKLKSGEFEPTFRSRLQVKFQRANTYSPLLALNEIFYAERDASRPTVHVTTLPEFPDGVVQRSSGVIVGTGTGSTAWMSSANMVHRRDVERVFQMMKKCRPDLSLDFSVQELDEVSQKVNEESVFSPTSSLLQYCMRELVLNGWQGEHDTPLSKHPKHGFASDISIKSLAWDGVLSFDGIESEDIPYGETLEISIAPPEKSLLTISFG